MKRKLLASLLCLTMGVTTVAGATCVFAEEATTEEATTDEAAEEETTEETTDEAAAEDAAKETAEAIDMEGVDVENTKIGISIYQFADNFMTLYRTELVRYLTEELGFKEENIIVQDGKNDQAEQTNPVSYTHLAVR